MVKKQWPWAWKCCPRPAASDRIFKPSVTIRTSQPRSRQMAYARLALLFLSGCALSFRKFLSLVFMSTLYNFRARIKIVVVVVVVVFSHQMEAILYIFTIIIHQIFSLARDWSKRVTWVKTGEYLTIILRNRAEYRLILSRRGRRPSWLKSDDIPWDWAG